MQFLYTIGHSARELADFTSVLQTHEIHILVDIRAYPASRRMPRFSRASLDIWLPEVGIAYRWMKNLDGMRM